MSLKHSKGTAKIFKATNAKPLLTATLLFITALAGEVYLLAHDHAIKNIDLLLSLVALALIYFLGTSIATTAFAMTRHTDGSWIIPYNPLNPFSFNHVAPLWSVPEGSNNYRELATRINTALVEFNSEHSHLIKKHSLIGFKNSYLPPKNQVTFKPYTTTNGTRVLAPVSRHLPTGTADIYVYEKEPASTVCISYRLSKDNVRSNMELSNPPITYIEVK